MVATIDDAFVRQFEAEVHLEYQRMGSVMRNTVRTKNNVKGESTTFQVAGSGSAGSKTRHGVVPIMNASRAPIEVTLQDRYAGEYIDKLDELKIEHDERQVAAQTIGGAIGRDMDTIILTAMDATTVENNSGTAQAFTAPIAIAQMEYFGNADIPFDGNLYAVVPWEAWGDLMALDQFNNQDYTPGDRLWFEGVTSKQWLGFHWFPFSGLGSDGTDDKAFFYHSSSTGHAIGMDFSLTVDWVPEKYTHLATGAVSHGAGLIDDTGCREFLYDLVP